MEALCRSQAENQELRSLEDHWEADLEQLRSAVLPRVEGIRFLTGSLPNKVGAFCLLPPESPGQAPATASKLPSRPRDGPGPLSVEYLPQDRESSLPHRLDVLRKHLAQDLEGYAADKATLAALLHAEEEEGRVLQNVLRTQLERSKKWRETVRGCADAATERQLRLKVQSAMHAEHVKPKAAALQQEIKELSEHLAALARASSEESQKAEKGARQIAGRGAAKETTLLRAREDVAFFREALAVEEDLGSQRIFALEEQLLELRKRYKNLTSERNTGVQALVKEVAALQKAVRLAEQLAAKIAEPTGRCSPPLEALALGPTVLDRCEESLRNEEAGARRLEDIIL